MRPKRDAMFFSTYRDRRLPAEDRFLLKVRKIETGCWLWLGALSDGYGTFGINGRTRYAHRFAYEYFRDLIPDGTELDHLCRVPQCVNPYHLEPVNHTTNCIRGNGGQHFSARTHCNHGHPFNETNTLIRTEGGRRCRECRRAISKRYRDSHLEACKARERAWQNKHKANT